MTHFISISDIIDAQTEICNTLVHDIVKFILSEMYLRRPTITQLRNAALSPPNINLLRIRGQTPIMDLPPRILLAYAILHDCGHDPIISVYTGSTANGKGRELTHIFLHCSNITTLPPQYWGGRGKTYDIASPEDLVALYTQIPIYGITLSGTETVPSTSAALVDYISCITGHSTAVQHLVAAALEPNADVPTLIAQSPLDINGLNLYGTFINSILAIKFRDLATHTLNITHYQF